MPVFLDKEIMTGKSKTVMIHGTTGQPDENWYPWLKRELTSRGQIVIVPKFPTPEGQSLAGWKETFHDQVGPLESNMILIGHSIGAGFILSLLEESSVPVTATFLVCGFLGELGLPEFDLLNHSFVCKEFNWKKIHQNYGHCCVINSDNDPYVALSKGEELAARLMVPLTLLPGAKHVNKAAGYTEFPFLLEKLQLVLSNQKRIK